MQDETPHTIGWERVWVWCSVWAGDKKRNVCLRFVWRRPIARVGQYHLLSAYDAVLVKSGDKYMPKTSYQWMYQYRVEEPTYPAPPLPVRKKQPNGETK